MARHYYIAEPLPDELIGSVLIRTARHRGLGIKDFTKSLAYSRQSRIPLLLSKHLEQVAHATQATPLELLLHHTPFGYITAFMSEHETDRFAECILSGRQGSLSSLAQSVTIGGRHPRYCQKCVKEDLVRFGESYWHRTHNLPFIDTCPHHYAPLFEVSSKIGFVATNLPEDCSGTFVDCIYATPALDWIAEQSIVLLEGKLRHTVEEWFCMYRELAIERGFPRASTGLCGRSICSGLLGFFGCRFFQLAGWQFSLNGKSWPALMLRERHSTAMAPGKHLIIQAFLKFSSVPAKEQTRKPGKKVRNYEQLDGHFYRLLQRKISQELIPGRPAAHSLLKELGLWETYRHERMLLPRTNALVSSWYTAFRNSKGH